MITDPVGRRKVLLPINRKNYNFRERKNSQDMKERENSHSKTDKGGVNCLMVDFNYNFECDWFTQLSDNPITTYQVN